MKTFRLSGFAVLSVLLISGATAADSASTQVARVDPRPTRRPLFSPEEIARVRERMAAEDRQRAAYILKNSSSGPVIELAPFIVEGDNSLVLAAVRRQIELGSESLQRRVAELAPMLNRQATLAARASDRFFAAQTPGGPADRPQIFRFTPDSVVALGQAVGSLLEGAFNHDSRD